VEASRPKAVSESSGVIATTPSSTTGGLLNQV
jgi:hypothetical protein